LGSLLNYGFLGLRHSGLQHRPPSLRNLAECVEVVANSICHAA